MKKRILMMALAGIFLISGCARIVDESAGEIQASPVNLTIWHYYNGLQKTSFDRMVSEFNDTVGREKNIYVESHNKGGILELERAVLSSSRKEVGSEEMPDIFSSYPDTAYEIDKAGLLADLSLYITEEEQAEYVDSYIEEGKIGAQGHLRIFPIAKSTEVLMINQTAVQTTLR